MRNLLRLIVEGLWLSLLDWRIPGGSCIILFLLLLTTSLHAQFNLTPAQEAHVDSLLDAMTLPELVGQTVLFTSDMAVSGPTLREGYKDDIKTGRVGAIFNARTAAFTRELQRVAVEETRLGVPLLLGYDVIHGYRTIFPMPLAEAASWDTVMVQRAAQIAAREASASGLHWTFAPMVDIARDPRWGRVMEGSGEDVTLGSAMARARVRGFQGTDLSSDSTILACAKHFAAYGAAEAGRDYNTVDISDRVLRETYLPPFKAALDAGVATYMTSFNEVDGVPASGSEYLLTDILRDEWGFDGFVVTDYTSINEMIPHGVVADERDAAALSLNAGVDMDMQGATFYDHLVGLVEAGEVDRADVREAARRILRAKAALGLFKNSYAYSDEARERRFVSAPEYLAQARNAAARSMVLLKHEGRVLPLSQNQSIALIGPLAGSTHDMIGAWSADGRGEDAISPLMGMQAAFASVTTAPGMTLSGGLKGAPTVGDKAGFAEALQLAQQADVIVACVGETANMSGEAASRTSLDLPGDQLDLLRQLAATGKPLITVVFAGRPLAIPEVDSISDAVLMAWWPGSEAGNALADVLSGAVNPSGRLPMTFPRSVGQVPLYYDAKPTGRPFNADNKYTSKYLDAPNTPLYAFGYGLGYSEVSYTAPEATPQGDGYRLSTTVTNTGSVAQRETVQFYMHDSVAMRTRPVLELLGWRQVDLAPGESQTVSLDVTPQMMSYLGPDGKTPTLEAGPIRLSVGPSSDNLQSVLLDYPGAQMYSTKNRN